MSFRNNLNEVTYGEIVDNGYSLSPNMYKNIQIRNRNTKNLGELLEEHNEYQTGNEPGSQWYVKKSNYYLIRTKALQEFSFLVYPKGDSIIPINPKKFTDMKLKHGDILLSKDSNIGEVAIINENECKDMNFSGGIVKLNISKKYNKYYVYAFLKHPLFKTQLSCLCPKGATIKHAGKQWLNCKIPFPNQENSDEIIEWIAECVQVIINIESLIARKSQLIIDCIDKELRLKQKSNNYKYEYPRYDKIQREMRLDAAIYCKEYEEKINLIKNYEGGYWTPEEYGFSVIPGPSLEIKLLKTRVDSDVYIPGFYQLLLPTNLSEYGTVNKIQYLGTKRKLPLLKKGDILFGEAGFHKGRSIVLTEDVENCTTNAHGLYARANNVDVKKSIFFRCIFDWYRNNRLIDLMAVGGSGGHFSPEYFEYIKIPKFDDVIINKIVNNYFFDEDFCIIDDIHKLKEKNFNDLGIIQLEKECKFLKNKLFSILDRIIRDDRIIIDGSDFLVLS